MSYGRPQANHVPNLIHARLGYVHLSLSLRMPPPKALEKLQMTLKERDQTEAELQRGVHEGKQTILEQQEASSSPWAKSYHSKILRHGHIAKANA